MREYILCAAIWYKDGKQHPHQYNVETGFIIGGYRHHNIIGVIPTNQAMNGGIETVEGFITSVGRFVDRKDAMKIAKESGQVDVNCSNSLLFSEDLY